LIDLDAAFQVWAGEFAAERDLGAGAVDWLVAADREGLPHRKEFFTRVRERFELPEQVEDLWSAYRQRMSFIVHCRSEVLDGLSLVELEAEFGVARDTLRKAVQVLKDEGLVETVQGMGIYVVKSGEDVSP
jgi:hypothetical protein